MTLRARLTAAFLAMVLGPVLLGAVFVAMSVHTVSDSRAGERLDLAANAVRTSIGAVCAQLRTVAETVSSAPAARRTALGARLVARGLAGGVQVDGTGPTRGAPPPPWADCADPDPVPTGYLGIAARAGAVSAAVAVDDAFIQRLRDASGASITPLTPQESDLDNVGLRRVAALGPLDDPLTVAEVAARLPAGGTGRTSDGHLVRRLGPVAGQPLPLAVSVPAQPPRAVYLLLILVVLGCAASAVVAAWWLARATTNPLAGLAAAADRVAAGDLTTRVPARGKDEIGRLATAFNHMTRELSTYVNALTASRDQLRGQLGVLGDTLSSTHDLDRILQVILQTARHATGAASGVVLLDESGVLVGKCTEGIDMQVRVPVGQGLVGSVAATGTPRTGRVVRDGPLLDPGEPTCRTYVVVPFCLGETRGPTGARGVLALYDRHGRDDFDDTDLDTLRTFAGQAAVAVDNVRVHEEAQRLSVTDSLTGLFNYRSLRDTLRRETERAARFGRRLAVLVMDLDHFKDINDRFGHAAGDAVLVEFAQRIRNEIREVDIAFRHGGEEFALLLPETDEAGGVAVAERLGEAIRRVPIEVPARGDGADLTVPVTVSIGIAVFPDHGSTGPAVFRAADEALYAAKAAGRDTFRACRATALVGIGGASSGPQPPRQPSGR